VNAPRYWVLIVRDAGNIAPRSVISHSAFSTTAMLQFASPQVYLFVYFPGNGSQRAEDDGCPTSAGTFPPLKILVGPRNEPQENPECIQCGCTVAAFDSLPSNLVVSDHSYDASISNRCHALYVHYTTCHSKYPACELEMDLTSEEARPGGRDGPGKGQAVESRCGCC
jgi:hypothetical protein